LACANAQFPIRSIFRIGSRSPGCDARVTKFIGGESAAIAALAGFLDRAGYLRRTDVFGVPILSGFQHELLKYLQQWEHNQEAERRNADLERMSFAANPSLWKELYMVEELPDGTGQIRYPTTGEEFEEMLKDWEGAGYRGALT